MKKTIIILSIFALLVSGCRQIGSKQTAVSNASLTSDEGVVINGIKWATRNVDEFGTFTKNPEDAGKFYQWNRKMAWNTTDKDVANWDISDITSSIWEKENDPCPTGWRVPTPDELQSLIDGQKVYRKWTTQNGVIGYKFTDRATNDTLFLPAVGYRNDGSLRKANMFGCYWGSPQRESYETLVYFMEFEVVGIRIHGSNRRWDGFSVRCVAE